VLFARLLWQYLQRHEGLPKFSSLPLQLARNMAACFVNKGGAMIVPCLACSTATSLAVFCKEELRKKILTL